MTTASARAAAAGSSLAGARAAECEALRCRERMRGRRGAGAPALNDAEDAVGLVRDYRGKGDRLARGKS